MKRFFLPLFFLGMLMVPFIVNAALPQWKIVPAKSSLSFTATQNNSPVMGQFKKFTGEIYFDPQQLSASHIKITVDIGSVTTSYGQIADTLKTPDWFDSKVFPQAVFMAKSFVKTGDKTYDANGTLAIRDKALPVVLHFSLDEYAKDHALVKGSTMLKRSEFGIGRGDWASTKEIKDDVTVNFTITATS